VAAIAVFHDRGGGWLRPLLRPGFRHCFCAVTAGDYWIVVDGRKGLPCFEVVAGAAFDLAAFYRGHGYAVVLFGGPPRAPRQPIAVGTCVGVVKRALGVRAPLVLTPYGLWKRLSHLDQEVRHVFAVQPALAAGAAPAAPASTDDR
jgi:hypothetical protein